MDKSSLRLSFSSPNVRGEVLEALKLSRGLSEFTVTALKAGLCVVLPKASGTDPASSPPRPSLRDASSQGAVLFNLLPICKAYGGVSFEKQKIPQFCFLKSFPPSTVKCSFAQKYKGKENPLKDLRDFSIRFNFTLKNLKRLSCAFCGCVWARGPGGGGAALLWKRD